MNSPIMQWRNYDELYALQGYTCVVCNKVYYPKSYICSCGNKDFRSIALSGKGIVVTFTRITQSTKLFDFMTPYCLGIIKLNEGVQVMAQIVDIDYKDITIGMSVSAVFRKLYEDGSSGIKQYGIKFMPVC